MSATNIDTIVAEHVAAERARCLAWVRAYAAYPKVNPAAIAIESGAPWPPAEWPSPRK